ncbi:MAG: Gfo/Idh/MocA family protein [Bacteroidota bacterium]
MPELLKVGVVGMGARGFWLARMANDGANTELKAIADMNPKMLDIARMMFPDVPMYDTNAKMAEEADIDAILVGTGDRFHAGNAREALHNGKHALIEKPLAQSFEDMTEIAHLKRDSGLTVGTYLELRFADLWKRVKAIIESSEIGDVLSGTLTEYCGRDKSQFFSRDKTRSKQNVVSLVLQKGVHGIDLLNWFVASSPVRVSAVGSRRFFGGDQPNDKHCRDCEKAGDCPHKHEFKYWMDPPGAEFQHNEDYCVWAQAADVEDVNLVNIEYANGAVGSYHEIHYAPYYGIHLTLFGSAAQLDVEANHDTGQAWIEITRRYGNRDQRRERPTKDTGHGHADPDLLADFANACLEGREPLCDLRAGYESAAIGVAARKSIDSKASVEIKPFETL